MGTIEVDAGDAPPSFFSPNRNGPYSIRPLLVSTAKSIYHQR
jgi:hypothetical protein